MQLSKAEFIERPITFGYDFRMRCEGCGRTSSLSGADYLLLDAEADARIKCQNCASSIHFGPLAVGIRDQHDPALDDSMLNRFAWYHTSTYENWPSTDFERDVRAACATGHARALMRDPERYVRGQLDNALHLGTYEAAIENMYRRMRNQDDERSAFHLYRVRVNIAEGRVNPRFRDENGERAADLSVTELTEHGLDAVRYLNAWEASGCISLAVRPSVITAVQTVPLPSALTPVADLPPEILDVIEDLERRNGEPEIPEEMQDRAYRLTEELEDALVARFLPGVNPKVADDFAQAVGSAHDRGGSDYLGHARLFAAHASLLTAPEQVLGLLDAAPNSRRDLG
ncbi:hypothetical protein [Streptomyces sp. NPDC050535]|uniref:hypothetical protein n=1 Tax=Streptomyces sp. NPDC050535 TaxID=3365626 RepID=UPI0037B2BA31